jgi:hypothetical protein
LKLGRTDEDFCGTPVHRLEDAFDRLLNVRIPEWIRLMEFGEGVDIEGPKLNMVDGIHINPRPSEENMVRLTA